MVFLKGTNYLISNLVFSLSLAIVLISLFMAWMFRSFRMILISIIPNMLPLLITAGLMGFFDIPIKPSTILVFSIAFGISVDDTIHFLANTDKSSSQITEDPQVRICSPPRNRRKYVLYLNSTFGFLVFTVSVRRDYRVRQIGIHHTAFCHGF